jgi:acyl transferase domain-containing protein
MTLAFILSGGFKNDAGLGLDFYQQFPAMRQCCEAVSDWTGLDVRAALGTEVPTERLARRGVGQIRQSAVVAGIYDVLAEHGVRPDVIGGLSLGAFASGCLSGAVSREQYFTFLRAWRESPLPPADQPPTSVAFAALPKELDLADYYGERRPGLHLAVDVGTVGSGTRLALISGYLDELRKLSSELPERAVTIREDLPLAVHSKLQQYLADYLAPFVERIDFSDPQIPVVSCLEPHLLRTADQVKSCYLRTITSTVGIPHMQAGLAEANTQLGIIVGPARAEQMIQWPFPVVQAEKPEHLPELFEAIHDTGVRFVTEER